MTVSMEDMYGRVGSNDAKTRQSKHFKTVRETSDEHLAASGDAGARCSDQDGQVKEGEGDGSSREMDAASYEHGSIDHNLHQESHVLPTFFKAREQEAMSHMNVASRAGSGDEGVEVPVEMDTTSRGSIDHNLHREIGDEEDFFRDGDQHIVAYKAKRSRRPRGWRLKWSPPAISLLKQRVRGADPSFELPPGQSAQSAFKLGLISFDMRVRSLVTRKMEKAIVSWLSWNKEKRQAHVRKACGARKLRSKDHPAKKLLKQGRDAHRGLFANKCGCGAVSSEKGACGRVCWDGQTE
eukprot:jgi/Botrbrau1/5207/Bobra.0172s0072.3